MRTSCKTGVITVLWLAGCYDGAPDFNDGNQEVGDQVDEFPRLPAVSGNMSWNSDYAFAVGSNPAVGINNNGDVYSVYNGVNDTWIRYRTGKIAGDQIDWSEERSLEFDGAKPTVDISNDNGVIVLAHLPTGTTSYRVGRINPESWGAVNLLPSNAIEPTASLDDAGNLIVVYRDPAGDSLMLLRGTLSDGDANWSEANQYGTGLYPTVGMTNSGAIVETHRSQNHETRWYSSGALSGNAVAWSGTHEYGPGLGPSVALNASDMVIEAHQSENHPTVWTVAGTLEGDKIDWSSDVEYGDGRAPSLALNDRGVVVLVYMHRDSNELRYAVGQFGYVAPPPDPVCGDPGEECCDGGCNLGAVCLSDAQCHQCGHVNQPCCNQSGLVPCNYGLTCIMGSGCGQL